MGCAVPTLIVCLMVVAIVWRGSGRKGVPAVQVSPDGTVTVSPESPTPAKSRKESRKDKKSKKADTADEPDQSTPPAAPVISVPGFNIPNVPGVIGKDGVNVQVQIWVAQGDKFMERKRYASAVQVYQLAASANPDDQTIKDKLAKAREARTAEQR